MKTTQTAEEPTRLELVEALSSSLTEYIVREFTNYSLAELEVVQENLDLRYSERVEDIFMAVMAIVNESTA